MTSVTTIPVAATGIASYWLVDPAGPTVTVLELREGRYQEVAVVEGERPWTAELPYPVTVVAADLAR
jgi:Uma2 family endonuclease